MQHSLDMIAALALSGLCLRLLWGLDFSFKA
ncbi:hypothetical protein clem_13075 [Legionella clemsonensis]|uniref:Uncharacterized protein n=1 Tax=Legionella clemsonensis TaxID=1867846 RepID=A0A222P5N2_9GAMM|nr:hypothetical protein clem_13075 [Legionella clemsonensis]